MYDVKGKSYQVNNDTQPAEENDDDFDDSKSMSVLRLGQLVQQQTRDPGQENPLSPVREQAGPERQKSWLSLFNIKDFH